VSTGPCQYRFRPELGGFRRAPSARYSSLPLGRCAMTRCQSPIEMSLALPIRDVTRGQGIASCLPLRSRPWHQAARLSWSGLLGRAAADPSLGRVTSQTGRMVTFLSGAYNGSSLKRSYGTHLDRCALGEWPALSSAQLLTGQQRPYCIFGIAGSTAPASSVPNKPDCGSGPVPTAKTTLNPAHIRPERRALHNEPQLDDIIKPLSRAECDVRPSFGLRLSA
jgi:hypothetical protein